jgi:hypothetical protein
MTWGHGEVAMYKKYKEQYKDKKGIDPGLQGFFGYSSGSFRPWSTTGSSGETRRGTSTRN